VGVHHHRAAGRHQHVVGGGNAARAVNTRRERLARYRLARERIGPATSLKAFERLVADTLDSLPPEIQRRIENVAVVVEERGNGDLLGLYEGVNRIGRAGGYHLATPDRITLFWKPIVEEAGADDEALRAEVRKTIIHEVAHYFGMDDAELEQLGG
jgi:predicted Zn-dependent protease with MMP-like domain